MAHLYRHLQKLRTVRSTQKKSSRVVNEARISTSARQSGAKITKAQATPKAPALLSYVTLILIDRSHYGRISAPHCIRRSERFA